MIQAPRPGSLLRVTILAAALMASLAIAGGAEQDQAHRVLETAGVKGGLIVHLGCGNGSLTAALRMSDSFVVHGLDADGEKVRQARETVRKQGLYGPVSIDRFDGKRLPYADNLANLVVTEDLGGVAAEEALRVLAPGGALLVREGGAWKKTVKPRPANVDEWTHYLHDAGGNAVARDGEVGPPGRVQWIADPRHTRGHEHVPGLYALVSAGGRIFYIADEASIAFREEYPRWHLVARDAYNGTLLWKRSFDPWFPHIVNWGATPPQLQRRLVATGDRVYITLGLHAPLCAVDAATGETLKTYEKTEGAEEVLFHEGALILALRSVTGQRVAELEKWGRLVREPESPLHKRETAEPLIKQLRSIESRGEPAVLALEANTGRTLWKKEGADAAGLRSLTLCADGDRVFYHKGKDVVCLDLKTGQERWSASSATLRLACSGRVVCAGGEEVTVLSAETGKALWTKSASLSQIMDVFVIGDSVWAGGFKPYDTGKKHTGPSWGPYFATQLDLATGKTLRHVEPEGPGHHHRCWKNKATERFILGGRRGVEFIDLKTGDVLWHSWVRGVCKYGVMPCNGLLYAPPHACGCYIAAKLTGFYALASGKGPEAGSRGTGEERLERGPAYSGGPEAANPDDWPTYRRDAQRSGRAASPVPAALRPRWQADVGGDLTSLTVAAGKVFVSSVDAHRVCALDAGTGAPAWSFTAGGRVDSPPTLHEGRAVFGCRDGHVYSVRAADGALAWRLRAAREDRRAAVRGQIESVSPVPGSVLVQDGAVYCTAGRSSYLDGGIDLHRVDPATGKILSSTPIYSPDPKSGRQPAQFGPCAMPGALEDILAGDGRHVYLRDLVFDKGGALQPKGDPHLLTLTGFLDDTWPHRSYWIYGTQCSLATGCSGRDKKLIYGRLLVFDDSAIYAYGRSNVHWSDQFEDGAYRLFSMKGDDGSARWSKPSAVRVRAMVLAGGTIFAAGAGKEGALLLAFSAADGSELGEVPLEAPPVFDGMAAAGGRLYLSLENGRIACLEGRR